MCCLIPEQVNENARKCYEYVIKLHTMEKIAYFAFFLQFICEKI